MCSITFLLLLSSYFWITYLICIHAYMLTPNSWFLLPVSGGLGALQKGRDTPGLFWRYTACHKLPAPSAPAHSILGTQANLAPGMWHQPRLPRPERNTLGICFLLFSLKFNFCVCWSRVDLPVVFVLGVEQPDSFIQTHVCICNIVSLDSSHLVYYRVLSRVPCVTQ